MKTAVEWLFDQIENEGKCIYEVIKQAKEMEKEQIVNAHHSASIEQGALSKDLANDYYNETFKSE
jgi:hypothetical protein